MLPQINPVFLVVKCREVGDQKCQGQPKRTLPEVPSHFPSFFPPTCVEWLMPDIQRVRNRGQIREYGRFKYKIPDGVLVIQSGSYQEGSEVRAEVIRPRVRMIAGDAE